jgi:iron donor protein CyaY
VGWVLGLELELEMRNQKLVFAPEARQLYNECMDDQQFRQRAEASIGALKKALYTAEESADFEVEEQHGVLNLVFDDPPAKFVITPNAPVRQIWISALSTSFKLDWSDSAGDFVLEKTGETLKPLVARLANEQLGEEAIKL